MSRHSSDDDFVVDDDYEEDVDAQTDHHEEENSRDDTPSYYVAPAGGPPTEGLGFQELRKRRRTFISKTQQDTLEEEYSKQQWPKASQKVEISKRLGLTLQAVQIWFQNRRAREKKLQVDKQMVRKTNANNAESREAQRKWQLQKIMAKRDEEMRQGTRNFYKHPLGYGGEAFKQTIQDEDQVVSYDQNQVDVEGPAHSADEVAREKLTAFEVFRQVINAIRVEEGLIDERDSNYQASMHATKNGVEMMPNQYVFYDQENGLYIFGAKDFTQPAPAPQQIFAPPGPGPLPMYMLYPPSAAPLPPLQPHQQQMMYPFLPQAYPPLSVGGFGLIAPPLPTISGAEGTTPLFHVKTEQGIAEQSLASSELP